MQIAIQSEPVLLFRIICLFLSHDKLHLIFSSLEVKLLRLRLFLLINTRDIKSYTFIFFKHKFNLYLLIIKNKKNILG